MKRKRRESEKDVTSDNNELITTQEAARISNFHIEHVRRLLRAGEIEGRRFGAVWMVNRQSLIDYLADVERRKSGPRKQS